MVIALAGRKGCGKTEAAKLLCTCGSFTKISFASQIKYMISNILDKSIDEINEHKEDETHIKWGEEEIDKFSKLTDIPKSFVEEKTKSFSEFISIRQMLQTLATNVIREYDTDWHVKRTIDEISKNPNKNYVIDDLRFENEKNALEKIGAEMWYVVRPRLDNISNHESETSLTWKDFGDKVLINDGPIYAFMKKWRYYIDYCLMTDTFSKKRKEYITYLQSIKDIFSISRKLGKTAQELTWEMSQLCIPVEKYWEIPEYDLEKGYLETNRKMTKLFYVVKDGKKKIKKEITNPLSIENLKIYFPLNN